MATGNKKTELKGLGGWLTFHWLGFILGGIFGPFSLFRDYSAIDQFARELGSEHSLTTLVEFEFFTNAVMLLALFWLAYLFFTKDYKYPSAFIWLWVASAALTAIDLIAVNMIVPNPDFSDPEIMKAWLGPLVVGVVWIPYILKSRRVANTFVEERPNSVHSQHDLVMSSKHPVPSKTEQAAAEVPQEAAFSTEELTKNNYSQDKSLILEYDDIAKVAYDELAEIDHRFAATFLQKLLDDPDCDIDEIKAASIQDNLPFDSAELNDAYLSLRDLGQDAQAEFVRVAGVLGSRLDLDSTIAKIRSKFDVETATGIIYELKKYFKFETRKLSNGVYIVTDKRGKEVGRYGSPKELGSMLSSRKIQARKEGFSL
jgi:energy-coupling factor transporter transmembrane protein EcfT